MIRDLHRRGPNGLCPECGEPFPCPMGVAMAAAKADTDRARQACVCGHQRLEHRAYAEACQVGQDTPAPCPCPAFRLAQV